MADSAVLLIMAMLTMAMLTMAIPGGDLEKAQESYIALAEKLNGVKIDR